MAQPIERYLYRCTTDKLTMHLARIEESGDSVDWPVFIGGRDWILVCRKGSISQAGRLLPGEDVRLSITDPANGYTPPLRQYRDTQ